MRYVSVVVMAALLVFLPTACQYLDSDSDPADLTVPEGFRYEVVHSPWEADSSSWVSLAADPEGRLVASDQYGALYRITPAPIGEDPQGTYVEKLDIDIGRAQGLLFAFGSLYVVVNNAEDAEEGRRSGLYRVTDTDGDDHFDTVDSLMGFEGWGEHGPHSIVLGPDGEYLYLIAGNHTEVPETQRSAVPRVWEEDQLLPVLRDPRGHAADRTAPGGWVVRTDPQGSEWELFSVGYRNAYDLAFNAEGDLFTFDSDMEWDLGMPWYRPVRVVHVTSGSEFGWRTGSGKWPSYYPDNLPAVVDIGQGSPTGVVSVADAAFPMRYRRGILVFDWSFGTIYWVGLQPHGSTYVGEAEEFLSGVPLPVTDGVVGSDGAFYFATGGRRLNSFLYRVWYDGEVDSGPVAPRRMGAQHTLRRTLETLHGPEHANAVQQAWPHLNHPDRFVRWAARIAIEHRPVTEWAQAALNESSPVRRIYALIALARHGGAEHRAEALGALMEIEESGLSRGQQLDLFRAYGLILARMGMPEEEQKMRLAQHLMGGYPEADIVINRERGRLLAALEAPGVVALMLEHLVDVTEQEIQPTMLLEQEVAERSEQYGGAIVDMRANMPGTEEIDVVMSLRTVRTGWTMDDRRTFFQWFYDAMRKSGGSSYVGFIEDMRADAVEHLSEEEKEALAGLVDAFSDRTTLLADLPQPEGPAQDWNRQELAMLMPEGLDKARNYARGEAMYAGALCSACHRMGALGGSIGPDLSTVGTRFGRHQMLEAIDSPSDEISDQYAASLLELTDGSMISGRIVEETDGMIILNQNPFDPSQTVSVDASEVIKRSRSPVSIMPSRLLNRLNGEEVLDLLAYLIAGGDAEHKCFTGDEGCNTKEEE